MQGTVSLNLKYIFIDIPSLSTELCHDKAYEFIQTMHLHVTSSKNRFPGRKFRSRIFFFFPFLARVFDV